MYSASKIANNSKDLNMLKLRRFIERGVFAVICVFMIGYVFIYMAWVKDELHKATCIKRTLHGNDFSLHKTSPPKETFKLSRHHPHKLFHPIKSENAAHIGANITIDEAKLKEAQKPIPKLSQAGVKGKNKLESELPKPQQGKPNNTGQTKEQKPALNPPHGKAAPNANVGKEQLPNLQQGKESNPGRSQKEQKPEPKPLQVKAPPKGNPVKEQLPQVDKVNQPRQPAKNQPDKASKPSETHVAQKPNPKPAQGKSPPETNAEQNPKMPDKTSANEVQPPRPNQQPPLTKAKPSPKGQTPVQKPKPAKPGQKKPSNNSNSDTEKRPLMQKKVPNPPKGEQGKLNDSIQIKKRPPILKDFPKITSGDYLHKYVILTTTTYSYIDFTENWLISIDRLGDRHPNIYIIAEDADTNNYFQNRTLKPYVHVIKAPQLETMSSLFFDTVEYKNFVNKRPQYILDILNSGHDVLFSDVDTFWFQRPYQFFTEDFDIFAQLDQGPPKPIVLCAGFVLYRATNATIQFVERWIAEIDSFKDPKPDQVVLNRLLQDNPHINKPVPKIKLKILDPSRFVSGHFYFDEKWRNDNPQVKPVVLHNNWIKGHDPKVERFKKIRKWFV